MDEDNEMFLNIKRCKFLVIAPKKWKHLSAEIEVLIGNRIIQHSNQITSLGLIIDNEFIWSPHVNYKLGSRRQILPYCSFENSKILVSATCISLIRYCSAVWGRANKCEHNVMDKCIRRCTRAVFHKFKFESISNELLSLGWLLSSSMYKYSLCLFIYMIIHNRCPYYFTNLARMKKTPYFTKFLNHVQISNSIPMH